MLCARKSRLQGPVPFRSLPGTQRQCYLIKGTTPTAELTCPAPGSSSIAPREGFPRRGLQFSQHRGNCSFTARLWDGKSISWAAPQIPISYTLIEAKTNGKRSTEEATATCEVWPSQSYVFKARWELGSHRQNRTWGGGCWRKERITTRLSGRRETEARTVLIPIPPRTPCL